MKAESEIWIYDRLSPAETTFLWRQGKDALTARKYWNKLKQRLKEEENETVTNCHQFKLRAADGKMRLIKAAAKSAYGFTSRSPFYWRQ